MEVTLIQFRETMVYEKWFKGHLESAKNLTAKLECVADGIACYTVREANDIELKIEISTGGILLDRMKVIDLMQLDDIYYFDVNYYMNGEKQGGRTYILKDEIENQHGYSRLKDGTII